MAEPSSSPAIKPTWPIKNYQTALEALNSLQSKTETILKWRNERRKDTQADIITEMNALSVIAGIDVPALAQRAVHVAGTKGKGTVCAMTESIIRRHGHRTGLYTSPHLITVRERIKLNGQAISEELFEKYFWELWNRFEAHQAKNEAFHMPGWFRFITLLAFTVFQGEKIDCAIVEVGIGGRTDATNVLARPTVCGVTLLDYDHTELLGNTLAEIAYEKSGIFKPQVPAVTVPQLPEPMQKLIERASSIGAPLFVTRKIEEYIQASGLDQTNYLGLDAAYQRVNAALAIALSRVWLRAHGQAGDEAHAAATSEPSTASTPASFELFKLPKETMEGLKQYHWPGRAQIMWLVGRPIKLYIDGAHTPESMKLCIEWFSLYSAPINSLSVHKVLVFNCNKPRSPTKLLAPIVEALKAGKLRLDFAIFCVPKQIADEWEALVEGVALPGPRPAVQVQGSINAVYRFLEDLSTKCPVNNSIGEKSASYTVEVLLAGSLYLAGAALEVANYPTAR